MTVDLVILGAILLFAALGAISGVARQVGQVVAMIAAYALARPLGTMLAPRLSQAMAAPRIVGTLVGTLLVFTTVMFVGRWASAAIIRKLLEGDSPEQKSMDRPLGFLVGGSKVAVVCYLIVSGMTFIEDHVQIAGQRIGVAHGGSKAFAFARRYNFFEMTQFRAVKDVVALSQATANPERLAKVKTAPAYAALRKDPRFRKLLEDPKVKKAAETGDYRELLKSDAVMDLISDPESAEKLEAAVAEAQSG
ncbi:MAG: CvpA family protein [Myxococcaceae bacterium]